VGRTDRQTDGRARHVMRPVEMAAQQDWSKRLLMSSFSPPSDWSVSKFADKQIPHTTHSSIVIATSLIGYKPTNPRARGDYLRDTAYSRSSGKPT